MYAVLRVDNIIGDFEKRNLPLTELIHEDFRHQYIEIEENHNLKIGDIWHPETKTWEIVPEPEPTPSYILMAQPTNAEVAQMISDLNADLLIAGVIS